VPFKLPRVRRGLVVNAVLISVLLVLTTALAVGAVAVMVVSQPIERAADSRLAADATSFQAALGGVLLAAVPILALITLAGAGLAYVLMRRVRQPVLALAAAATRLRAGDDTTPLPFVRPPELRPLVEELERARSNIQTNRAAAANEEARQRALIAALAEPILIVSPEGRIADFNAAASALFGQALNASGRPIQEVLPFVPAPPEATTPAATWYGTVTDAAGHTVDVDVRLTQLAPGRNPATNVYVVHDISRHAELNRLREQLLYSVAHELRAPMAVLQNALEILATDYAELSAAEFDQLMGSARRTVIRLNTLMEDLLSAGSIQSGRFHVRPEPTPLATILEGALEAVEMMIQLRGQRVGYDIAGEERLEVRADPRYARQVLSNLLANASKYSPDGETISVHAQRSGGMVRISVADRGPGIPPEQRAGLFERFYRVRPGNEEPGIGLGLAIAKGIVEAHGGSIGVDTALGAGTTVWFTLPLAESLTASNPEAVA
jgi:signal transduction histidine kinase